MSDYLPPHSPPAPMPPVPLTPAPGAVFSAPYAHPPQGFLPPTPPRATSSAWGVVALVIAVIATFGASLVAALAAVQIGPVFGPEMSALESGADPDLTFLAPVKSWVLLAEIAFWAGTVLGIWALVQGIVAIARRRGTGFGIAAIVVAVLGPVIFTSVVAIVLTMSSLA